RGFGEEARCVRHFVYDSEGEDEIDAAVESLELHRLRARDAGVDSVGEIRIGGPAFEPFDHLRLDIHCDDAACAPDPTGEFKREEPHSRARLKDGHGLAHIWGENRGGVLPQAADRTEQEIPEPPRTYAMLMRFRLRCRMSHGVSSRLYNGLPTSISYC